MATLISALLLSGSPRLLPPASNAYGGSTSHSYGSTSHESAYGTSSSHTYGEGSEHTNEYGGSTEHSAYGGTEHTNAYGGTTSGEAGYGAEGAHQHLRTDQLRLGLSSTHGRVRVWVSSCAADRLLWLPSADHRELLRLGLLQLQQRRQHRGGRRGGPHCRRGGRGHGRFGEFGRRHLERLPNAGVAAGVSAAAVPMVAYPMGAMYAVPPAGSMTTVISGQTYYLIGNSWFQPAYGANGVYYRVVPAP